MSKITKETKIREILMSGPAMSRILISNGLSSAHINANILDTLESATVGKGMPENLLEKTLKELNEKLEKSGNQTGKPKTGKIVSITMQAAEKIKEIMAQKNISGHYLRFGMASAGCAAYTYDIDFEKNPAKGEIILEENGVKMLVPKKSLKLLGGCTIDYVAASGGFKIENPNVKRNGS